MSLTLSPPRESREPEYHCFPVPLRPGTYAWVVMPRDTSGQEAVKIARVLGAMVDAMTPARQTDGE